MKEKTHTKHSDSKINSPSKKISSGLTFKRQTLKQTTLLKKFQSKFKRMNFLNWWCSGTKTASWKDFNKAKRKFLLMSISKRTCMSIFNLEMSTSMLLTFRNRFRKNSARSTENYQIPLKKNKKEWFPSKITANFWDKPSNSITMKTTSKITSKTINTLNNCLKTNPSDCNYMT